MTGPRPRSTLARMLTALAPRGPVLYVLKQDRALPADEQSSFTLQPPTIAERYEASVEADKRGGNQWFAFERLRIALRGWERVRRAEPRPDDPWEPFPADEHGRCTRAGLDLLPEEAIIELLSAVAAMAKPSRDELGKS